MKRLFFIFLLTSVTSSFGKDPSQVMNSKEIRVAMAAHNRAIHIKDGWIRDPYITKGPDGFFYLTGTTQLSAHKELPEEKYTSGKPGFEVNIWRSRDFIHWKSTGAPYTLKDGIWPKVKPERFVAGREAGWRLWAPELYWINGKFTIIHCGPSPVEGANLSMAPGAEPKGPWTNPLGEKIDKRHDPSMFRDDDGTWWMIWGGTSIAPLKSDLSDFAAEPTNIGPTGKFKNVGYEGCLIRKIHEKYVLFGTAWSTGKGRKGTYNLYYATADKITGPYSERRFAGRFLGHGTMFRDNADRWWCTAFFNGNTPPLSDAAISSTDCSNDAYTINDQGVTIVPVDVLFKDNDVVIRPADPAYASPGPEEDQKFQ